MSAVLGVFDRDASGAGASEGLVRRMLGRMARRGPERLGVWRESGAALAAGRYAWELASGFSGPVLVVHDGEIAIAADASLYYRDDLRRALASRGVRPRGQTPSHLILAAYRAWGTQCAAHLEGDFAFVLYDRRRRRVLAARDFVGSRPLHWAELHDGTLLIASTIGALTAYPGFDRSLDLAEVALEAAGLGFTMTARTVYANLRRLNPGEVLVREADGRVTITPSWQVPVRQTSRASSFEDGAAELREILAAAVYERLAPEGPTSVWLSGGHDSTAVFAAGHLALTRGGDPRALLPVSVSLPVDDPQCENQLIEAVARRWDCPIHWIDSTTVPLVDDPAAAARDRDDAWTSDYEQISHALCRATEQLTARVALNGHGGDLLFWSSPVTLADHLRRLQLVSLWREWQTALDGQPRELFKWAVQPLLPDAAHRLATTLRRGRRLHGYYERIIPSWFRQDFRRQHGLDARSAAGSPRAPGGDRSAYELAWLASHPQLGRLTSDHQTNALQRGADIRSPLMDSRVIAFAASRPASERRWRLEGKRLLRKSMEGLLPDAVVAPRRHKTGTLHGYARRAFDAVLPSLADMVVDPVLGQLGIIDVAELRRVVGWVTRGNREIYVQSGLLATMNVELWLRSRLAAEPAGAYASEGTLAVSAERSMC